MAKKRSSSGDLFTNHNNLKWLLPVFALVALGFIYVLHHAKEEISATENQSVFKQNIRTHLQTDNDKETTDDNATVSPTRQY